MKPPEKATVDGPVAVDVPSAGGRSAGRGRPPASRLAPATAWPEPSAIGSPIPPSPTSAAAFAPRFPAIARQPVTTPSPPGPPAPGRTPHPRRDRRNLPSGARPTSGPMGSLRRPSRLGRRMRLVPTGVGVRARTCPAIRITGSGRPPHPRRRSLCRLRGLIGDAKKGMPPKVPPCSVWLWYTNIMP